MPELQIEQIEPSNLKPYPRNARTHSRKQVRQIAESIKTFGFTNPILIDETSTVLAGHGRVEAAKLLGTDKVPCVRLSHMSAEQKRAYVLADNKLALNAGWDEEILATELQFLLNPDLQIDIGLTGFSPGEVDLLIDGLTPEESGDPKDDRLPPLDERPITRPGDLWVLGPHKVLCGDALKAESFVQLMGDERAQMVFADPPYNVPIEGHVSGLGRTQHREFAMASGEMSKAEFTSFLSTVFCHLRDHSTDGSIHFICMDWRHMDEIIQAGNLAYSELKNLCVWVKDNAGMGSFYRSRHELVFAFKSGSAPHLNTFELGQYGRYRTNVWQYRGVNSFKLDRAVELELHPTVKPVAMIADAIKDVSERGRIILDCFGGSGSTLIAAHKAGRVARLIEFDPRYVDRSVRRWDVFAKDDAVLASTNQSFAEVAAERLLRPGNKDGQ